MSEYIAKASIEPRDYRVVFLIQQKATDKTLSIASYTLSLHGKPILKRV